MYGDNTPVYIDNGNVPVETYEIPTIIEIDGIYNGVDDDEEDE